MMNRRIVSLVLSLIVVVGTTTIMLSLPWSSSMTTGSLRRGLLDGVLPDPTEPEHGTVFIPSETNPNAPPEPVIPTAPEAPVPP